MFSLLLEGLAIAATPSQCVNQSSVIYGSDGVSSADKTLGECCAMCLAATSCAAFTWDGSASAPAGDLHTCWLKTNTDGPSPCHGSCVSGLSGRKPPPSEPQWYPCNDTASSSYKFCDAGAPLVERLDDLVARINPNEVGHQLTARQSPNIDRIGLPSYYWGTNAIHGVQNVQCLKNGACPTSFPAPVGLSASYNMSLVKDMGGVIGRELRAYWNGRVHNSLDTWSPTININRDPRWGRNVESPGEDPLLNGLYGAAYTTGLQKGADPSETVTQAVVTLKHWFAYNLESYNGTTRHNFDAKVSAFDLASTYMRAWEIAVKADSLSKSPALGIMCSYNMVNGIPTCANTNTTRMLREDWGFKGYITSDTDSCSDIHEPQPKGHGYVKTGEEATKLCLAGGTDIDSGNTYADFLASAVNKSIVSKELYDAALRNSYRMRFIMGLFDPAHEDSYSTIPLSEVGSEKNVAMSVLAAQKSLVLLKNDKNTLPFAQGKKIAVVGTSSNSSSDITGNYVGPLCNKGGTSCVETLADAVARLNVGGETSGCGDDKSASCMTSVSNSDLVVLVISNAHDGGGEGGDREHIALADDQIAFATKVIAAGKPTVIVMINGGVISLDGLKDSAPAILMAWMPGAHGAGAVAQAIFGDINPGGKMPVTMYPSSYIYDVSMLDMSMQAGPGRSYKFYTGTPLYTFGYGISYTTFSLAWAPKPPAQQTLHIGMEEETMATTKYTCTVKNTGTVLGDEVVMAFVAPTRSSFGGFVAAADPVPIKVLVAFERVTLAAGASTTVSFEIDASRFSMVDADGHRSIVPGAFNVILTRGHGAELASELAVRTHDARPKRLSTFRKWW